MRGFFLLASQFEQPPRRRGQPLHVNAGMHHARQPFAAHGHPRLTQPLCILFGLIAQRIVFAAQDGGRRQSAQRGGMQRFRAGIAPLAQILLPFRG